MKTSLLLPVAGILFSGALNAQIHLFLQEQEIQLPDAQASGWVFPIARDFDEAFGDLQQYSKDRSDVRMRKEADNLYIAEKVSIPVIASKRGDLVGYGFSTESYHSMAVVFLLGYDISVNRSDWPMEMNNLRNFTKEFMSYHYEQSFARRIDALEKSARSLERDIDQNERRIGNMEDKIENTRKKIEKETDQAKISGLENEVATLESDIEELSNPLPGMRNDMENMTGNVEKLQNESLAFQNTIAAL